MRPFVSRRFRSYYLLKGHLHPRPTLENGLDALFVEVSPVLPPVGSICSFSTLFMCYRGRSTKSASRPFPRPTTPHSFRSRTRVRPPGTDRNRKGRPATGYEGWGSGSWGRTRKRNGVTVGVSPRIQALVFPFQRYEPRGGSCIRRSFWVSSCRWNPERDRAGRIKGRWVLGIVRKCKWASSTLCISPGRFGSMKELFSGTLEALLLAKGTTQLCYRAKSEMGMHPRGGSSSNLLTSNEAQPKPGNAKVSTGPSHPNMGAAALLIAYLVLGRIIFVSGFGYDSNRHKKEASSWQGSKRLCQEPAFCAHSC